MSVVYMNCPNDCGDEFEYTMSIESADDGDFVVIEEVKQRCSCRITEEALEYLDEEAVEKYMEDKTV